MVHPAYCRYLIPQREQAAAQTHAAYLPDWLSFKPVLTNHRPVVTFVGVLLVVFQYVPTPGVARFPSTANDVAHRMFSQENGSCPRQKLGPGSSWSVPRKQDDVFLFFFVSLFMHSMYKHERQTVRVCVRTHCTNIVLPTFIVKNKGCFLQCSGPRPSRASSQ